jgi:uncharacterized protein YutE (UPF0331/DUF86 family)
MTPPRLQALLQRKLSSLTGYLDELQAALPATRDEYLSAPTVRRAVERLVQVVVECAADAGDLLLTAEGRTVGDSARDIFEGLHSAGIIDDALRQRFAYAVWQAARQLVPEGRALLAALVARVGP